MIRNEHFANDGSVIRAEIVDLDAGTVTVEEHGVVTLVRELTDDERWFYAPKPLDAVGALATLLAVEAVVSVEDAASAVGLTPADLVTEALGWAAAADTP